MDFLKNLFPANHDVQVANSKSKMLFLQARMNDTERKGIQNTIGINLIKVFFYRVAPESLLVYVAFMGVLSLVPSIRRIHGPFGKRFLDSYGATHQGLTIFTYTSFMVGLGIWNIPVWQKKNDPALTELFNKYKHDFEEWREKFDIPDEEDL